MSDTMRATGENANHRATTPDAQDNKIEMEDMSRADSVPAQQMERADALDQEGDDDSEEDEEYEIEDILGHELKNVSICRVSPIPSYCSQACYASSLAFDLISWVGYGPEHNSWTLERDFGSTEIIAEYWNKKGGRPAPNSATKSKKKSTITQNSKRTSSSRTPQSKKRRMTGGSPPRNGSKPPTTETEEPMLADLEEGHKDSIAKYKDLASWEEHVDRISTVERGANNRLVVYMIMKDGARTAQDSAVVHARCPQKMLEFYEAHLRWRHVKS